MAGRATIICSLLAVLLLSVLGNATGPRGSEKEEVSAVTASASQSITYQGVLKDASENPIPNAALNIIFRVYDDPDAGDILWQQRLSVKTDKGGYFNAILSDLDLPSDRQYYLSLQVEGDAEMSPRQTLRLPGPPVIAGSDPSPPVIAEDSHWRDEGVDPGVIWPRYSTGYGISLRDPRENPMHGIYRYTHINLGYRSETGELESDYSYSTVGGGSGNKAKQTGSTVAGGSKNEASGSYSAVSGGKDNIASGSSATVSGGEENLASGNKSTIGGGEDNTASSSYSTVGGGYDNTASGSSSVVSGGKGNLASGSGSTIGGGTYDTTKAVYGGVFSGNDNLAGNDVSDTAAFVGGGSHNAASGKYTVVSGGWTNSAIGSYGTISGGKDNLIWQLSPPTAVTIGGGEDNEAGGDYNTISGGRQNYARYSTYSTIGGGQSNDAGGDHSTIGGGWQNSAHGTYSIIGGGLNNAANGDAASIAGGYQNTAGGQQSTIAGGGYNTSNGNYSTVPGGTLNDATGANSFAAGKQAKANDSGTFVWADATGTNFASTGINQFLIRADGGVGIGLDNPGVEFETAGSIRARWPGDNTKFIEMYYHQTEGPKLESGGFAKLTLAPDGVNTVTVTSSGNVGIGTDDPQKPLDVRGWIYGESEIKIINPANRSQYGIFYWDATNSRAVIAGNHYQVEERPLYISTGDATFTDDKVGIGTTSPQAKLDIAATGDGVEVLRLSTERSWAFRQLNTGQYTTLELASIGGGGNKDFIINTTGVGKVGIGTTTPDAGAKLHVWGAVTSGGGPTTGIDGKISIKNDAGNVVALIAPDASNHGRIDLYNASEQAIVSIGEGLDYAEGFATPYDDLEPGTVMIIDPQNPGNLRISASSYDKRVAGIVAGANGLSSGVKLGSTDADGEHPVALAGRVYCKVDGKYGAIEPGDLLTTSPNPGFAMVVSDYSEAQGAILGKAMEALTEGEEGEILVLVTLQ